MARVPTSWQAAAGVLWALAAWPAAGQELPGRRATRPERGPESGLVSAIDAYLRLVPDAPKAERLVRRKADRLAR